jgi:hypothetical protein
MSIFDLLNTYDRYGKDDDSTILSVCPVAKRVTDIESASALTDQNEAALLH